MKGWKQAYTPSRRLPVLVELDIDEDAVTKHVSRYGLTKDFYTCSRARVVAITSLDGKHFISRADSMKVPGFMYEVGKEVVAQDDPGYGDSPGIYFFKRKKQALEYEF